MMPPDKHADDPSLPFCADTFESEGERRLPGSAEAPSDADADSDAGADEATSDADDGNDGATPDAADITVSGKTARSLSRVESVSFSVVVATGSRHESLVLVPFVDCDIYGARNGQSESSRMLATTLTFDNVALLIEQFAHEFAMVIRPIAIMSANELRPAPNQLEFTLRCLESAISELTVAAKILRSFESAR
jgi:hypothetical protein